MPWPICPFMRKSMLNPVADMKVIVELPDLVYLRCLEAAEHAGVSLGDWLLAAGTCGTRLELNLPKLCEKAAQMSGISVEEYMLL